jgi:hypothetical protein
MKWKLYKQILYIAMAIIVAGIFFISCGEENGDIVENGSGKQEYKTPIELLPRDNDISGWMRDWTFSEATNYASLYDLINGAAQLFIDNGFVSAVFQNYIDGSGLQVELRIYEMDAEENAFRIYNELATTAFIPWVDAVDNGRIDNSALTAYSVEFQYRNLFVQSIIHEKSDRAIEIAKLFALHVIDLMKLGSSK